MEEHLFGWSGKLYAHVTAVRHWPVCVCVCLWFVGVCDDRGVWVGVLHQGLGSWLLLQISWMEGTTEICQEAFLCHRLVCVCGTQTYVKVLCVFIRKLSPYLFSVCFLSKHLHRLHSIGGILGRDSCRDAGQHLCHLSPAQHALPADLAYGPYGPSGRHLETTGLSGLRSQQGGNDSLLIIVLFLHMLYYKDTLCIHGLHSKTLVSKHSNKVGWFRVASHCTALWIILRAGECFRKVDDDGHAVY